MAAREDRTVKMLKKSVEDAQKQVKKGINALKKASEGAVVMARDAKPLGKDLMNLADAIAAAFEKAIPEMTKDLRNMEKAAVKRAKDALKKK